MNLERDEVRKSGNARSAHGHRRALQRNPDRVRAGRRGDPGKSTRHRCKEPVAEAKLALVVPDGGAASLGLRLRMKLDLHAAVRVRS